MGIRGLTAYVAARQDACATEVDDLKNVTLGVDLDSFLHFACRELANSYNAQWLLLGGDARALYVWVREWMQPLFKRKIRLKFVRDPPGMLNIIKDVTHGKRRAEKADKTKALMRGLFATTTPSSPQGVDDNITVPAPPSTTTDPSDLVQLTADAATNLMDTQAVFAFARKALVSPFVRCLKHAGCTIVTAPTEADETLGEMVRSKAIYAVVARDSDYLFMYKMRYITLSSIVVDPSSETVRATVFDTDQLAAASGLAPEKLVEWAIVCGNDFTPYVDLHFHLAEALHLPSLRQTQGNYNIGDALVWLQTHLGPSNNWLDDPEFHQLLADDTDLLAHVYGIYSFYGAGDQVKSRFPHASRHSVLSAAEWKYVRKLLDKLMLPSFTIDVLYDQRRSINKRSVLLGLSACPMLAAARAGTYGLLGQTHVEEYETCILTGDRLTRTVQVNPCDMVLKTMNQHAKSKRVHKAKAMVLTWVESSPAVHAAMAAWHPPKKQPDLKYVGYALGMVLASTPVNRLSSPSWMALLLTSVVSICLQKDKRGGFPFASSVGFTRELVELTARFLSSLEALSHVFDILTLHTDVNMHAFYSASLVVYFLSNGPISKSNVRDILLGCFHTLMAVFAKALPPSSAPSTSSSLLMPSQVIAKHVDKMAVKGTKAAPTKQKHKPVQAASAQTPSTDDKSPLVLEPLAWDEDVDKSSVESKQPPPPRVTDLRQLIFTLPVYKHKAEILHHVATNPLVVIQGETGCGKSTSVPQFLLDEAIDTANIYVTQPRRVAAITLAATVAKMRGETV
ncbi:hypothetical protein DYB34_009969 [Aphanomyces astaci]|uniref:XPG-I domain-containing protein n=1 Tax=Aphanomyces astaci TaxID=112090 RepID=A0A418CGL4_APHAT|nr:hypothetical protein DYB34_009969 [Aphanomyces astaci]